MSSALERVYDIVEQYLTQQKINTQVIDDTKSSLLTKYSDGGRFQTPYHFKVIGNVVVVHNNYQQTLNINIDPGNGNKLDMDQLFKFIDASNTIKEALRAAGSKRVTRQDHGLFGSNVMANIPVSSVAEYNEIEEKRDAFFSRFADELSKKITIADTPRLVAETDNVRITAQETPPTNPRSADRRWTLKIAAESSESAQLLANRIVGHYTDEISRRRDPKDASMPVQEDGAEPTTVKLVISRILGSHANLPENDFRDLVRIASELTRDKRSGLQ